MENNKLLIGIQFTYADEEKETRHYNIELYVLRDITLAQLFDGIRYGLKKLAASGDRNRDIYGNCAEIFNECIGKISVDKAGCKHFANISLTSYNYSNGSTTEENRQAGVFYTSDLSSPICDLGFITSTRIVFDATGKQKLLGKYDLSNLIDAFDPQISKQLFFPEYNISSRQLYQFDTSPVEVIAPTDPPRKQSDGLLLTLLPSVMTVGILLLVRVIMMSTGNGYGGISMILLSVAMGVTAVVTTIINWKKRKKDYKRNLKNWRTHYQAYIDRLLETIKQRQKGDVKKLNEIYPDMLTLINVDEKGVYSLNDNMFCRSPQDADFLSFRLGISNDVQSLFEIKGSKKDVVYSEATFDLSQDASGNDHLNIYVTDEEGETALAHESLCRLPTVIADKYRCLENAPLLYSLRDKGALGIVDPNIESNMAVAHYFISRMIFELCYYHSPDDLQFVIFFNRSDDWREIENIINRYKFMPHFRGLFSDRSQFVFDSESANHVMSQLISILNERQARQSNGGSDLLPHIVFIVFEEHGLKEHAFAEYLPTPPQSGKKYEDTLGLTFVFAKKFKEHLPMFCSDIINVGSSEMTITPHENIAARKRFRYDIQWNAYGSHFVQYTKDVTMAFRFFSTIYYAHIAQNGKVPSSVGCFELNGGAPAQLAAQMMDNWRLTGARTSVDVTRSLCVPVGITEAGTAYIDLHESADGPHMLVAGTTGSGKTESIITLLLELCIYFRPDELNLLLVDMKGGGFTKRIGHLPHVVGSVTDVDGDENGAGAIYMLSRFLFAMKAEIKRRKILFNKLHVDSIDSYINACNNIEAHIDHNKITGDEADEWRRIAKDERLSHLILVVDEFTELKRFSNENNDIDFIGEITTIARVGRSLGFHIILISQNIEGAITEDIRVNCRARLCLKVATKQASKDMLGTDLAASPFMPGHGRAYFLVGTGSKFEYFQSGYAGADVHESLPIEITLASKCGQYSQFYRSDKDNEEIIRAGAERKQQGTSKTQLEYITETICDVYRANRGRIGTPHKVFLAPLPTNIVLGSNGLPVALTAKRGEAHDN